MDATSLLVDRLEALRERLSLAEEAIGGAQSFATIIAERRGRLEKEIGRASASAGSWHSLSVWEEADGILFREALAYLQATGRSALLDSGGAPLARALVAELCGKLPLGDVPVIAPDVDDSFSDFVQIIRLRYPPAGVWDVPIIAHELGHFAAYRLTRWEDGLQRSQAVRDFIVDYLTCNGIESETEKEKWRYRLNELFADAFATYCTGPSYAASALLLRFDVVQACDDNDRKHPSYAMRAAFILEILREMNQNFANKMNSRQRGPYAIVIGKLETAWSDLLTSAQVNCNVDWATAVAYKIHEVVRNLAPFAQYDNWRYATEELQFLLTDPKATPDGTFSVCDLLNAAWAARARGGDRLAISKRVLQLWQDQRQGAR